jgi:hypothetical protein
MRMAVTFGRAGQDALEMVMVMVDRSLADVVLQVEAGILCTAPGLAYFTLAGGPRRATVTRAWREIRDWAETSSWPAHTVQ